MQKACYGLKNAHHNHVRTLVARIEKESTDWNTKLGEKKIPQEALEVLEMQPMTQMARLVSAPILFYSALIDGRSP